MSKTNLARGVRRRITRVGVEISDRARAAWIRVNHRWPCPRRKYLLVGSESSGTTAISKLLFEGVPNLRFLEEGRNQWVWTAYRNIFREIDTIYDYPRLQLFDAIKVPGFAMILTPFSEAFPNTKTVYIVRDPRDFVRSAMRTWKLERTEQLASIPWSRENWLRIDSDDPVERLATRWRCYLRSAMQHPGVLFLRYEDFCANKVDRLRDVARGIDLPFDEHRVRELKDQQLSHHSVRDYAPRGPRAWTDGVLGVSELDKIERVCHAEMEQWGYATAR